jgi:hypothetical protein
MILPPASTSFLRCARQAAAKFVIQPGVAEVALLVSYPFLQAAVRLDREFRHVLLQKSKRALGLSQSNCSSAAVRRTLPALN